MTQNLQRDWRDERAEQDARYLAQAFEAHADYEQRRLDHAEEQVAYQEGIADEHRARRDRFLALADEYRSQLARA